jgi:hypothetical protein
MILQWQKPQNRDDLVIRAGRKFHARILAGFGAGFGEYVRGGGTQEKDVAGSSRHWRNRNEKTEALDAAS